jgi:hypothetical protein
MSLPSWGRHVSVCRSVCQSVIKSCAHFSPKTADRRDLKLCTMLHYHLVDLHIVRTGGSNRFSLSYGGSKRGGGCEIDCAHFSDEMTDQRGLKLCTMLHYHLVDLHIVRTEGSNRFSLSYGGSKRGGGCEIDCAHFSDEMTDQRGLKLCTMLHYS